MDDLGRKISAEKENVEKVLNNITSAVREKEKTVIELAAIATFLHNIYNGIENILKQVLKAKGVKIPKSETWHKNLLEFSVNNGIISGKLSDELYEYLTFRNFFIHSYIFMLEEAHLEDLANNIPNVWSQYFSEVEKYCQKQDDFPVSGN